MYKNIELESTKYWVASLETDYKQFRRARRLIAMERFTMFAVFVSAAGILGYMLANGYFENVDVIGTLERFGTNIGVVR